MDCVVCPDASLKKLLDRVKKQREHWLQRSNQPLLEEDSPDVRPRSPSVTRPPDQDHQPTRDTASPGAASSTNGPTLTQYSCGSSDLISKPSPSVPPCEESSLSEGTAPSLSQHTVTPVSLADRLSSNGQG